MSIGVKPWECPQFPRFIFIKLPNYIISRLINKKNTLLMKKQSVKKWIKGFFPDKPKKMIHNQTLEVQKFQKKQEGWCEAQAQIVNHLISMDSLIKISKQINQQQYAMLCQINETLCHETIDLNDMRKCLIGGLQAISQLMQTKYKTKQLPYQYYSVRSLLWKIGIGYLTPSCKEKWISFMEKNLAIYRKYILQHIVQPIEKKLGLTSNHMSPEVKNEQIRKKAISEQKIKDHPLNFSQQSKWGSYFKDVEVWTVIEKDIKRTRKSCKFFQQRNELQLQNDQIQLKPQQVTFTQNHQQTYADSLTRIIFIYLKNHPSEVYCQGMNQIAALVYYCFTNKNSQYFRRVSQSDAYFVFQIIMSKLPKKHFQKGQQYVKDFINVLKKLDLRLYEQIQKNKGSEMIKLITMKWFLSGFLTQFNIDQCLLIWDAFISWPISQAPLTDAFTYMALSLVHLNRQKIMKGQDIALIFNKISNSASQVVEKTQNLYKLFPKLLQK